MDRTRNPDSIPNTGDKERIVLCCLRRGLGTGLGELAAETLAGRGLVALYQLGQRGEGLPRRDVVPALPVQRLDLVVLHVIAPLLVTVMPIRECGSGFRILVSRS